MFLHPPHLLQILPGSFQVQISFWIQTRSLTSIQLPGDLHFSQFQISLHKHIHHQPLICSLIHLSTNNSQLHLCHGHLSAPHSHSLVHPVPPKHSALLSQFWNHLLISPLSHLSPLMSHPCPLMNHLSPMQVPPQESNLEVCAIYQYDGVKMQFEI